MNDVQPRRVFVSHASEDKERFVLGFATALRERGIDAWVDKWELLAGDSLVARIFEHGIETADAFVVVLSNTSVTKPWVREELDAVVVRRIESNGVRRIMPVVLDAEVKVPSALKHLLWLSVRDLGLSGVVDDVVRAVHGRDDKPALGPTPGYSSAERLGWLDDPIDDVVLGLIIDEWRKHGPTTMLFSDEIQDAAKQIGIGDAEFEESMSALLDRRTINAKPMAGGGRWWLDPIPNVTWLKAEATRGIDVPEARRRVLASIVNEGTTQPTPEQFDLHVFTLQALLRDLAAEDLMTVHELANGEFSVSKVSPLARRALRE